MSGIKYLDIYVNNLAIFSTFNMFHSIKILLKGGIEGDHLKLVLEPEAASVWYQQLELGKKSAFCRTGSKYMVVDMGGKHYCPANNPGLNIQLYIIYI